MYLYERYRNLAVLLKLGQKAFGEIGTCRHKTWPRHKEYDVRCMVKCISFFVGCKCPVLVGDPLVYCFVTTGLGRLWRRIGQKRNKFKWAVFEEAQKLGVFLPSIIFLVRQGHFLRIVQKPTTGTIIGKEVVVCVLWPSSLFTEFSSPGAFTAV